MIQSVDYGPFSWHKFFKMLTQNLSIQFCLLPHPSFYFGWGSIDIGLDLGRVWPRKYLYKTKHGLLIHCVFVQFNIWWWIHNPNPYGR